MNIKQNNYHKPHTVTHCQTCGRRLPTRCRHRECAGCRKRAQGRMHITEWHPTLRRWMAYDPTTRTYSEATAYVHRHQQPATIGGQP